MQKKFETKTIKQKLTRIWWLGIKYHEVLDTKIEQKKVIIHKTTPNQREILYIYI